MSLLFTVGSSDRVDCGSAAAIDDVTTQSGIAWIYPTSFVNSRVILSKFRGATNEGWEFYLSGTSGHIGVEWAGSSYMTFTSNSLAMTVNAWNCVAYSLVRGTRANLYVGNLTTALAEPTYASSTLGSGFGSDAARSLMIGNRDVSTPNAAFPGRIGPVAWFNRELTIGEFQSLQYDPRVLSGCLGLWRPGDTGTGTQPDYSGNGLSGTVTGATQADNPPLRRPWGRPGLRVPYAVSATVTHELAGADAIALTASGALTVTHGLTGAAALAMTATGNADVTHTLIGADSIALTVSADATITRPLAGAETVALTVSGDLTATHTLVGAGAIVLTASGALDVTRELAGAEAIAVTAAGAMTVTHPLIGAASIALTASGDLSLTGTVDLVGADTIAVAVAAALDVTHPMVGADAIAVTVAGALTIERLLVGAATIAVTASGNAVGVYAMLGSIDVVLSVSGDLVLVGANSTAYTVTTRSGLRYAVTARSATRYAVEDQSEPRYRVTRRE